MEAICIRRCFYQGRLFKEGEALLLPDDAEIPAHFSANGRAIESVKENEPTTFYGIQQAEKAASEKRLEEVKKALEVRRAASAKPNGKQKQSTGEDILG